jgi:presenilin 1
LFLSGYVAVSFGFLLYVFGWALAASVLETVGATVDVYSFAFAVWNWTATGMYAIFGGAAHGCPPRLTQAYLVAVACVMAWHLSNFPPVLAYVLLGFVALWDVCAVLLPFGPLNLLIQVLQRRTDEAERLGRPPPASLGGLLFEARFDGMTVKLGLGDFIFYSLLVAVAAKSGSVCAEAAAFTGCAVGLVLTILHLATGGRALPALPASIALGLSGVAASVLVVDPMLGWLAEGGVYV